MTRIQEAAERLRQKYGSWRKAEQATGINYNYLYRLSTGQKTNPSEAVLAKLGLEVRVNYVRKGNGT